jgi:hypothetical protein
MIVIGVDPGPEQSAFVVYNGLSISQHEIVENDALLTRLSVLKERSDRHVLIVEQIAMGGMIAGPSVFETCFWSGRFVQEWSPREWNRLKRINIKNHICGFSRAVDKQVREALIERFGPGTAKAIGTKRQPGPLYGISSHQWAALAVAVTWFDLRGHEQQELRPGVRPMF